jgi:hypothetical protein
MRVPAAIVRLLHVRNITSTINSAFHTLTGRACNENPYCTNVNGTDVWSNDCGIERPSTEGFIIDRDDMIRFFRSYFNEYVETFTNKTLQEDERTIPQFLRKRLAPNMSPSAVICDGRSKCQVDMKHTRGRSWLNMEQIPSCEDFGKRLSKRERQYAWYIFEFFSILDHAQRAMHEGTEEFFNQLHLDVRDFVKRFSFADEQQTIAEMEAQLRKMILAMITAFVLLASAAVAGMQLVPNALLGTERLAGALFSQGANMAKKTLAPLQPFAEQSKSLGDILSPVSTLVSGGYIGLQGIAVTFDPIKDTSVHTLAIKESGKANQLTEMDLTS